MSSHVLLSPISLENLIELTISENLVRETVYFGLSQLQPYAKLFSRFHPYLFPCVSNSVVAENECFYQVFSWVMSSHAHTWTKLFDILIASTKLFLKAIKLQ